MPKRISVFFLRVTFFIILVFSVTLCKPTQDIKSNPVKSTITEEPAKPIAVDPIKKDTDMVSEPKVLNIGFLMPFAFSENLKPATDELQTEELITSSVAFLEFYEGAKMAADSLNYDSLKIKFNVYDTYDTLKIQSIISNPNVYTNNFVFAANPIPLNKLLVSAAKLKNPIIWTQASTLKSRQLMSIQPNNQRMISSMASYLAKHFADAKITVVYRDTKKEKELGDWFAAQIDTAFFTENGDSTKVLRVNHSISKTNGLLSKLSKTQKNLIVVTSSDEAFISPLVKVLNDTLDVYDIQLCGLPTWENFESVNFKELEKLQTLIFTNNYIDFTDTELANFRKAFIDKYATDPLYQAYQGFFLIKGILKTIGTKEEWLNNLNTGNFKNNMFKFNSINEGYGYENTLINVLKFDQNALLKQ